MRTSEDPLDESMTVVKTGTCGSLTGKSRLTYHIGTLPDSEVYIRIHKNTGNGFFSREWVSLKDIQRVLAKVPAGKPVTAIVLNDLFQGRSVNTPGFLLSVLLEEKLLMPMPGMKRHYEAVDPGVFLERIDRLGSAGSKPKARPKKTAGSTPRKTSPASRKKAALKQRSVAKRKAPSRR